MEPTEKAGGGGTVGSAAPGFEGGTQNSATTLKNLGYQCGYQSLESKLEKEKPQANQSLGVLYWRSESPYKFVREF